MLGTAESTIRRRSMVFVISDFISAPGWAEPLAHLSRRHEVVAVRLYDPLERELPDLGMLLMQDPKLLLLDEPVAGMTDEETERTAELFLSLEGKHSLVVVEHDMKFVDQLTEGRKTVTVLHEGSVLAEGPMDAVQADPRVIEVYLGGQGRAQSAIVGGGGEHA